jgi:chromosome segregation ATPase
MKHLDLAVAVRNSSKHDDQPQSDQPSKTRGSERSLREAGRADLPGVSEPSDNDEARHHIAELEAQVQELRSRGDNWQKAARAAAAIQARLSTLEGELKQLRSERDSWVSKAQTAQATSDESSQRVVALEADLANLRVERDSWQTAAESARTATTEIRERFAALSADLNKLRDERDASATNADAAQETVADLRQHSATLQADLDQLRGERESLIAQAEEGRRARQERAIDTRALRREIAVNIVAAIVFCVAIAALIFFGRLW